MKKFIYLCGMMLLSLDMMAQIDLNDRNWDMVLFDDFTIPGRYWIDSSFISSDSVWKAYSSGLTHGNNKMLYQYSQCHFNDEEGYMELVAEYARDSILGTITVCHIQSIHILMIQICIIFQGGLTIMTNTV